MYASALFGGLAAAALLAGCTAAQPRTVYVEVPAPPPPPPGQVEHPRGDCGIDPARMSVKTKARCGLVSREPAARHCDDPRWWNFYDSDDVRTYLRWCGGGRDWVPVLVPAPVPVPVPYEAPGSPPPTYSPPPSSVNPDTSRSPVTEAPESSEPRSPATESVVPETGSSEEPPASSEESSPSQESESTEDSSTGP
ncbi:hypothetical protein [Saccharopolyspora tripterygii]